MTNIILSGKKDGYSAKQCGRTLTVGELKAILEGYEDDAPVYIKDGSIYQSLNSWSIDEEETDED